MTHDLEEAIKLAESMMKLNGRCGFVERDGRTASICNRPKGHTVAHRFEKIEKTIPF